MSRNCATTLVRLSICLQQMEDTDCNLRLEQFSFLTIETLHVHWLHTHIEDVRHRVRLRSNPKFPIVNFPFLCSNIRTAPAYGVYISQLICYSKAGNQYHDFLDRARMLTHKLLRQGYVPQRQRSSLQKFYGDLVYRYGISFSQMKTDMLPLHC